MLELRPTTNLKSPANLILKGEAARTNFLYLYNSLFGIPPLVAYAKMCFHAFLPTVVGHKAFGADRKLMRTITSPGEKGLNLFKIPRGTMRITKELSKNGTAPGFRVSLPMFRFSSDTALRSALMGFVNFSKLPDNELQELMGAQIAVPLSDVTETQALVMAMAGFPKFQAALEATNAVLYRENHGADTYLFLSVTVRAEEAQQLTTTPFDQIRPSDLYTVLLEWALAGYGTNSKPPKASFQITRIARTLPQSEQIKPALNSEMITLDAYGHPLMIPKVLNKTSDYDQKYFDAGIREDGSFQLISNKDTEEDQKRRKPPANMPVLVDWLNGRFAYTDTNGGLKTLDLTKCRAPNATQLVRLASKPFSEQVIKQMMGVCRAIGMPPFKPDPEALESVGIGVLRHSDLASEENILNYLNAIFPMFEARTGRQAIRYIDFGSGEYPPLNAVFKYFQDAGILALQNPESIYQTYSVIYAVTTLPYFLLVSYYGQPERFAELMSLDNEERKPYYQQKPDENWGDESLPLAGASLGQLPHQKRVRNQLRNFPKAAILPIQAGGGKTPIIIMDILKFVKAKKGFPYLIMCPSHLVAQYVSEIAFFTDGKLNPIPINTASCNTNGLKRLTQIIQSAPRNTVVIVDYDVCSRIATDRVVYGTTPVNVYHIIEFLRQFNFGYCALDEAHYLRRSSGRTEAVQRLVLDIPYKRLASGTFAHDSVSDLVSQLSLIDPTMFGTRDEFHERYALEMAGNRVRVWRPNAENEIKAEIKRNMVEARAYRKEWAALLPPAKEDLHIVTMSEAQRSAYNALVSDVMVEIKEKAKTNPLLQKWLDRKNGKAEEGEGDEDSSDVEDDIQAESLEQLLKKYLARVERFCTAMGRDDWGKLHLSGDDLVSPKINKIIEIITDHVQKSIPGKIIVFTNYVWSAEEIYAALPSNIKSRFVLYKAGNKTECMAKFEAPETIGMVGVSSSMDTGLNLQAASRLIRDGYVWNPGTLEQGDSRIGRPQLKVAETRDYIYYDTVLLNGTVDITKMCRIFSKSLSVAKYDNSDDPAYADLPSLPVVPMKFESLEEFSDARTEAVKQFYEGYSKYKYIRDADYKEFRERYSGANRLTLEPVEHAADPEDAAILEQTPYIPGYDLYGKDQLGLVRLDHYLNENINISESSELDDDTGEDDATQSELWLAEASKLVVGQLVHSQNGDGRITKIGPNTATYVTAKGVRATQRFSTLFLMKKPIKGGVRNALATITKLPLHKVDNIVGTKRQQAVKVKPPKVVAPPVSEKLSLELWPVVINGFLCLEYQPNGDDDPNINALQSVGFRRSPPYKYAQIRNHIHLLNQFKKWAEVGMAPDPKMPELNEQFQNLFVTMKAGKLKKNTSAELLRFANQTHLKNFMRMELKPNNNPEVFRPFPLIENNKAYIVLPVNGQLGTKKAMLHRVPLTKWFDGPEVLQCWTLSIQKSVQVVKSLINSGVQIANSKELERELKSLRKAPVRKDDESFYSK